ncbi:Tat (twin-arginine translocation) pathway signal sequence [Aliiroseovarius sediminilitoris]|jgi:TRAP-type mannitol/chloroaromatic compound transport system substrate-binding protein|uniref:Tat (Twin-arginine translocation) pathway signal sequence n=1 Tax=Aliiroseovarius sediminilitoris TaxID=1173584 RepID=A0A1I0MUU9_9RHOB|nr:TRAP transporter substrate-binding protein [Aliiroseovarius sediminilitoris]SEV92478.1 Tat (twin-arginine translocation) pathway signal sequence [Aliiroseovarius sediminilitoris]
MERRKFLKGAAIGAGATALATPALAQGGKTMTIVSTWPRDFPGLGVSAQRLADRIGVLSEGALNVEYFAAGERVGALDVFDEVASGNSQAYIGADYYWTGKHPALAYFTAVPFGMSFAEINAWCLYGGGMEIWDKVQDQFGLKGLPAGNTGTQAGGWFNKEIESADDFKGLKMRIPGLGGQVLAKLGASTVSLPGGQIYENLVSGTIDATEWVGPYNDYFMKFYEAAKYYYTGGMHEPGAQLSLTSNKSWWSSLSDWERAVITAAALEENANSYFEAMALNGEYLTKLVDEQGVEVRSFNDETWDAMGEAAQEVFEETASYDALAAEVNDAVQAKMREIGRGISLFEGQFVNQRNRILDL